MGKKVTEFDHETGKLVTYDKKLERPKPKSIAGPVRIVKDIKSIIRRGGH